MNLRSIFSVLGLLVILPACNLGFVTVDYGEDEEGQPSTTFERDTNQSGTSTDPQAPGTVAPLLQNATFGTRCVDGATERYLVLSNEESNCATHAEFIDASSTAGSTVASAVFDLESLSGPQTFEYCENAANCRTVTFDLAINDQGSSVSGRWTGAIRDEVQTVDFAASPCDYDSAVAPLPGETLATDISIENVSVYQGVKVPIVSGGNVVTDRNAPIVAGRPGIVRVFVEPEAGWQSRELIGRLTMNGQVYEERFTPQGMSSEMEGQSTLNFTFESGEIPADADVSVELLEAASCSQAGGTAVRPRVPESGTFDLDSREVGTLKITLVPIEYEADGSNRRPDLGPAVAERFRETALSHYPVEDVEVTVREPVSTPIELSPGGAGFGDMLNFCLNVRNQDNPDPDVYYYCVIQPAESRQGFCGGGCVGGVAPVPGATNAQARAGIGIGFNGGGEDVFVHEIGHTLGRPHSPCGGAAGTDPNYPYAQGAIGSWGYDILTGQLFQPDARADFMGYCNPTWVSDYTYSQLFDRLERVLMTQSFRSLQAEQRWRTAVIQDGSIRWGDDRVMRADPAGLEVHAALRGIDGSVMDEPRVFVTPVADIDAVLLTVEETAISGGAIDIPGLGQFPVQ